IMGLDQPRAIETRESSPQGGGLVHELNRLLVVAQVIVGFAEAKKHSGLLERIDLCTGGQGGNAIQKWPIALFHAPCRRELLEGFRERVEGPTQMIFAFLEAPALEKQ